MKRLRERANKLKTLFIRDLSDVEILFETDFPIPEFDRFYAIQFGYLTNSKKVVSKGEFISNYRYLRDFLNNYGYKIKVEVEDTIKDFIINLGDYKKFEDIEPLDEKEILDKLEKEKFLRRLMPFQMENVRKLCSIPHGADFSVPGAGKTTDALAFYAFKKNRETKLFIVSPINAYLSWEEDINNCLGTQKKLEKLRGDIGDIKIKIDQDKEFYWTNYNSFNNPEKRKLLEKFMIEKEVIMILDESHKAKGPTISKNLSKVSIYPKNKLILTGTPMPQADTDLDSQFSFLFPRHDIGLPSQFIQAFKPFYVRTSDKTLGLLELKEKYVKVNLYPGHLKFYQDYIDNKINSGLSLRDIMKVKDIKSAYMRYIRFMSNPASIADFLEEIDLPLAKQICNEGEPGFEGDGAKIDAVVKRAEELINEGQKVLIWSSFVNNVHRLSERLKVYGADYIDGSVKSESNIDSDEDPDWGEEEQETREAKIRSFKENPNSMVLVANPAAAAESMSLHTVCNYALYLDRTYNAAHYLQSQKRIHRLSVDKEYQKYTEIFYAGVRASIDVLINKVLAEKCNAMHDFLNESEISENWVGTSSSLYFQNLGYKYSEYSEAFEKETLSLHQKGTEEL